MNDESKYRKDMFKAKRKPLEEIWFGNTPEFANITRFAPSACNTQPWYVENKDGRLTVYRYKKEGKRGIIQKNMVTYFNRIDIGIYLCILEICMQKHGVAYRRELFVDAGGDDKLTRVAEYSLVENK